MSSMLAGPISARQVPSLPTEPIWRLSVANYHEMIRAGILADDDPVELLDGWLVLKMSKNPPHVVATGLLRDALARLVPPEWFILSQDPITTLDSEPEPDLCVTRGSIRDFSDHHPSPSDVAIVVEVADSSLPRDRGIKKTLYARAGIPVYWIVDLTGNQVEMYAEPSGPTEQPDYRLKRVFGANDFLAVLLDGKEIGTLEIKSILP